MQVAWAEDPLDETLNMLQDQAGHAIHALPIDKLPILRLVQDPRFLQACQRIVAHPDRKNCLYAQLGFLIFMIIFKAWRQSRQSNWFGKLFVSFYCSILFWSAEFVLIPYLIFGEDFRIVLKSLWALC